MTTVAKAIIARVEPRGRTPVRMLWRPIKSQAAATAAIATHVTQPWA